MNLPAGTFALAQQADPDPLLALLTLPVRPEAELVASTQQILKIRPDLLSTVLTILFERFPTLTPEEIMVIAGIPTGQLLHTRAAQDLLDRGRLEGEAQGEAKVTLRQLNRRCGPLSEGTAARIQALPLVQLESLAEALLDFSGPASTGVPWGDWAWCDLATVMEFQSPSALPALEPAPWLLDRQGWSTLAAGALLLLISLTTNYGDDNLLHFGSLPAAHQVGVGLHLAALAALVSDAELASRLRHRAANEAAEDRIARKREALEAAEGREQATRRARIQNGCLAAQCRFLLADTSRNRLQLSEALAVLLEELRLLRG